MKYCSACAMPLVNQHDFALGDTNATFCRHCVHADGTVKSCKELFEGGVLFFMKHVGGDRIRAERMVRKNMSKLAYWKGKNCPELEGDMATDEEFDAVMKTME